MTSSGRIAGQLSLLDASPSSAGASPVIRVVIPCSSRKLTTQEIATRDDLDHRRAETEERLAHLSQPARELYAGKAYQRALRAVDRFAERRQDLPIALHIASAGYGIVQSDDLLVPYEAIMGTTKREWAARGIYLGMPAQAQRLVDTTALTIFALSQPYFHGAALPALAPGTGRVVVIGVGGLPDIDGVRAFTASRPQARGFGTTEREVASVVLAKLLDQIAASGPDAAFALPTNPMEWPNL